MLSFAYEARDPTGKTISGVQEALDEDNAVYLLMTQGLMVLSIQAKIDCQEVKTPKIH